MIHITMILPLLLVLIYVPPLTAQLPESDEITYRAYVSNQDVNEAKEAWKKAVKVRENEHVKNPKDIAVRYKLALAQFGLLHMTMQDKDEALFEAYVDETEKNLESLCTENKQWAEPHALLSAVYGLTMAYSPWKGMYLGSKSENLMEEARMSNPDSPLVWKLYANSKYFTPEIWGGDLKEAIKAYQKSIQLYESDSSKIKFNWYYLDTFAFLGQAYTKNKEYAKTVSLYEKALAIEPEFHWVKHVLLPKAMEQYLKY